MNKILIAAAAIGLSALLTAGSASASSNTHTVVSNDTFWKLSKEYSVSLDKLMQANPAIHPDNIKIGEKLTIPGKKGGGVTAKTDPSTGPATIITNTKSIKAASGQTYSYSRELNVKATAYTAAAAENGKWGAVDYFGNKLKVGTVAVDPKMIPLGTKLYVTGYQYNGLPAGGMIATATDMGGSIKGNRIDLFVPGTTKQAMTFGIQNVKVYVLK